MEIKFVAKKYKSDAIACLSADGKSVIGARGELDQITREVLAGHRFSGKPGQSVEILAPTGMDTDRIIVLGTGEEPSPSTFEKAGAKLIALLAASGVQTVAIRGIKQPAMRAHMAFGSLLASYRFDKYRSSLKEPERFSLQALIFAGGEPKKAEKAFVPMQAVADGVALARDLVSEPPNVLYPESYAHRIEDLFAEGLTIKVFDESQLRSMDMNLLLGVGQGSFRESRLCVLEWYGAADKAAPPLALVGKGVTFDTGGISIKPSAAMDEMKGDMAGSAAVIGTMLALARRKARANIVGIVGLVENMPGGQAIRPGDIIRAASGKTVEILNTDAEGRLVLADALWYAQEFHSPRAIIDLATLTGAIIISLGHDYAGLFSSDDNLANSLLAAGEASGEKLWRFPLGENYDKMLDSMVADIKNISAGRAGSSITAAQFLKRFVEEGTPWAHLDIAGMAWKASKNSEESPGWATGFGVRVLDRLISDNFED